MKAVVFLLLACVVAASAWQRHVMREPSQAVVNLGHGIIHRGMEFHSDEWTDSPYTLPSPKVVVVSRTCETDACPPELPRFTVACYPVNAANHMMRWYRDEPTAEEFNEKVSRWSCGIGPVSDIMLMERPIYMLEVRPDPAAVIICEDENGEPFALVAQPYLPNSCFVKVALLDHTRPEPVKRENPMLHTPLAADPEYYVEL